MVDIHIDFCSDNLKIKWIGNILYSPLNLSNLGNVVLIFKKI